jgi:hypothetical protein
VIVRTFREFVGGKGLKLITQDLTRDEAEIEERREMEAWFEKGARGRREAW